MKKFIVILAMSLMMFGCSDWFGDDCDDCKAPEIDPMDKYNDEMKFNMHNCSINENYPEWGGDIVFMQVMEQHEGKKQLYECKLCLEGFEHRKAIAIEAGEDFDEEISQAVFERFGKYYLESIHALMSDCDIDLITKKYLVYSDPDEECEGAAGHLPVMPQPDEMLDYRIDCRDGGYTSDTESGIVYSRKLNEFPVLRLEDECPIGPTSLTVLIKESEVLYHDVETDICEEHTLFEEISLIPDDPDTDINENDPCNLEAKEDPEEDPEDPEET